MDLKREVRKYLKETGATDFEGWKKVEIYCEESLVDAWIAARPEDRRLFYYDPEFANFVDNAQGKFLEPRQEGEPCKVLVSTRGRRREQVCVLVHELRHACDYVRAAQGMSAGASRKGTEFWFAWSEYRAVKTDVEVEYWQELRAQKEMIDDCQRLEILGGIFGRRTAVGLANLTREKTYRKEQIYFLVRYLAVQRKLHELLSRDMPGVMPVFSAWDITPDFIRREYGDLTELCDLWDSLETCELTATAPCFTRLWRRVGRRCKKLAEKLWQEEEARRKLEEERREAEIREIMEEIRPDMVGSTLMNAIWKAKAREGRLEEVAAEQEALLRDMAVHELARREEERRQSEENDRSEEWADFDDFDDFDAFDGIDDFDAFDDFDDLEETSVSEIAS